MKAIFAALSLMMTAPAVLANPVITPGKTACDFDDIEEFVAWFGGSATNQQSASSDPLDAAFMDMEAREGPALVESPHAHDELGWPILPDLAAVKMGHKLTYTQVEADTVQLQTTGGMGVDITYTFKRQPCWTLIRLEDRTRT